MNSGQPTAVAEDHRTVTDFAAEAKQLYSTLLRTPGCTWSAAGPQLPDGAPDELRAAVAKWRQWLQACSRLHVLLHKPFLFDAEAAEAELLARRLNHPIRRLRLHFDAPEAGWSDMTTGTTDGGAQPAVNHIANGRSFTALGGA